MLTYSIGSIIGLVFLVAFVLLNMSVQQLVDFESIGLEAENTEDARIISGSLRLRSSEYTELGVFELSWDWCPNWLVLNWCTELDADSLNAEGQIGYRLSGALGISSMQFEIGSLDLLGMVPGLLDARLTGQIESLEITDFSCPLRNARNLEALVEMRDPKILGNSLESIRAELSQSGDDYRVALSGDEVTGEFLMDSSLSYQGKGEMTPPPSMAGLMDSMAIPLGNGRYGWELAGEIPC